MTDPPSTEKAARPPDQTWQRFTLLDALLLQAGMAMGFSAVHLAIGPWRTARDAVELLEWVVAGTAVGAILAGPLVLGVQSFLRGRREPLSSGEWIWLWQLAPPGLVVLYVALPSLLSEIETAMVVVPLSLVVVPLVPALSLRSLWVLFCRYNGQCETLPSRWTDAFGLVLSVAIGLLGILACAGLMLFY